MATLLSRRCIGTLGLPQGSSLALAGPSRRAIRKYAAAATATKQKPKAVPAAAKAAPTPKKPPSVIPVPKAPKAPIPKPKALVKKSVAKSTKAATASRPERPKLLRNGGGLMFKVPEKKDITEMTEEEQLAQLERAMTMSQLNPTRDIWGQSMETLAFLTSFISSMLTLAGDNAIPGVDLSGDRWWHRFIIRWPWRLATTTSVAESSWLSPLRKSALDTYCKLNTALAKRDDQTIKELASSTYQDQILRLRKKQRWDCKYFWHFHKEVTPARVLSIRAAPGYLAIDPPKFGNRNAVQALVRIDTEQSLEIYTDLGVPLHTPAAKHVKGGSTAEPVRVTEYLVFEKKMWYDGPWVIREQLWEAPGRKAAV
ncbi:hypothetical protein C0989_011229 [Termitomyces sp. Mn162]|nr:hypothetical protein C0989_011229 [Termitomyces sp. Mn162]